MKLKMEGYCEEIINFLPRCKHLSLTWSGRSLPGTEHGGCTGVLANEILGKGDYAYAIPFYGDR
jgi:hypothetical protein